jgi:hypothetical protein
MLTETALKGPDRRPAWASDARARSAKKSKSCANPPRFERRCEAYKCIMDVLQYPDDKQRAKSVFKRSGCRFASRKRVKSRIWSPFRFDRSGTLELKIQKLEPLPHPEQRDRQRQRGNQRPCAVRPPSQQGRRLRRAAVFAVAKHCGTLGMKTAITSANATTQPPISSSRCSPTSIGKSISRTMPDDA